MVGVSASTESLGTGSIRFQIRCTLAPGTLENTCSGPVKSSWVTLREQHETDLKRVRTSDI